MKAMILAAGLGTRLHPLTIDKPKALVEIAGKTLLQMAIEKVSFAGYHDLVINVHHLADQIIEYLYRNNNFGLDIVISDEREQLLDTGGGIKKATSLLSGDGPFLVYNVDVLSSIDLQALRSYHDERGGLATLAVRERNASRYLVFNENLILTGWKNVDTGEEKFLCDSIQQQVFAFSGIQIIDPAIFKMITESGSFSLISLYLRLARSENIYGYIDTSSLWMDLGKPDQLKEAEKYLNKEKSH
jgi:NDP-sugar pyrophosphorylase family protein